VRETVGVLSVCVDCHYWLHYGWEEGACYSEGYSGPREAERWARYWIDDLCSEEGEPLEPHYSSSQCGACGSGLAGDRMYVTVGLREESVL
jgi:hypothetical protein